MVGDVEVKSPKYFVVLAFMLFVVNLISCSDSSSSCPLTVDTVEILQTKEFEGTKYYLVKRITGWHDKVIVIQLFNRQPKLDPCNKDIVMPIFEDSIEMDKSSVKLLADIKNNKYEFIYGDKLSSDHPITLEFKK
jgi:hypothetical protein